MQRHLGRFASNAGEKSGLSRKESTILILLSVLYLSWFYFAVGLRQGHVILYVCLVAMYLYGGRYRRAVIAMSPFVIYLSVYDSLRAFPNYSYNNIHIEDLYLLEKQLFGVLYQGQLMTLNELFFYHQYAILDIISGVSYLTWLPVPLGFALYLYLTGKKTVYVNFALLFVLTNLIGFAAYYLYPAAPPWYVDSCGFEFFPDTACEVSRLGNFDSLTGIRIFEFIYQKNANVFAAMPSIHAANPMTCFLASFQLRNRLLSLIFFLVTCGIWFGAVYGNHHYLLDVLAGGLVALTASVIVYVLMPRTRIGDRLHRILTQGDDPGFAQE